MQSYKIVGNVIILLAQFITVDTGGYFNMDNQIGNMHVIHFQSIIMYVVSLCVYVHYMLVSIIISYLLTCRSCLNQYCILTQ